MVNGEEWNEDTTYSVSAELLDPVSAKLQFCYILWPTSENGGLASGAFGFGTGESGSLSSLRITLCFLLYYIWIATLNKGTPSK